MSLLLRLGFGLSSPPWPSGGTRSLRPSCRPSTMPSGPARRRGPSCRSRKGRPTSSGDLVSITVLRGRACFTHRPDPRQLDITFSDGGAGRSLGKSFEPRRRRLAAKRRRGSRAETGEPSGAEREGNAANATWRALARASQTVQVGVKDFGGSRCLPGGARGSSQTLARLRLVAAGLSTATVRRGADSSITARARGSSVNLLDGTAPRGSAEGGVGWGRGRLLLRPDWPDWRRRFEGDVDRDAWGAVTGSDALSASGTSSFLGRYTCVLLCNNTFALFKK